MSALPYTAVLFDLDGTIVDSAPGITASLATTFERMHLPVPPPAKLLEWVGPPILDSFRDLAGFDAAESAHALDIYREIYREGGVFDATPYPGVVDLLADIRPAGMALSLATSKPESLARAILDRLGAIGSFDELTGASEDEKRSAMADVVEEALRRLRADGADLSRPVMVGDRRHDVEGAAAHDVPTVFVSWGYGSPAEQAGAVAVADDAPALRRILGL
jgi:phosphoglycolate phosphatase